MDSTGQPGDPTCDIQSLSSRSNRGKWSRHSDLNRGPAVYETAALPLSYVGASASIGDDLNQQTDSTSGPKGGSKVFSMASSADPGSPPGALPLLGHFPAYARDPLGFVTRVSAEYGGVVPFRLGPYAALLLTDPAAIDEVLVAKSRDFRKSRATARVGVVVGNGLLLSEGDAWRANRRVV